MSVLSRRLGVLALGLFVVIAGAIGTVVAHASITAKKRLSFPDVAAPPVTASKDPAVIERGRYLVHGPAHCSQCHGTDQRSKPELNKAEVPLTGGLAFAMGPMGTRYAANLTPDPETGIGKLTDAQLARAIRTGIQHDGEFSIFMRYAAANLSDDDLAAVISYLRAQPPVRRQIPPGQYGWLGKVFLVHLLPIEPRSATGPAGVQAGPAPTVERGAYLAESVSLCVVCHSKMNQMTFQPTGPKAGGGLAEPSHGEDDPGMELVPPNLTSDPTGYTGRADEDAFVARMKAGRAINSSIMPWEGIAKMTEVDLRSVYRYLRSLPPVKNDVGPTYRKKGWKPGQPPI
jgi:mono/diheme cytochrome c family protein